jgi:hypothetical protein
MVDWLIRDAAGFFTFVLVIVGAVQAGLFVWQLRYMRASLGDAKRAALAAQAVAETAKEQVAITKTGIFDLERAYLAVGPTEIKIDFQAKAEVDVTLLIHNTGRTSATIKTVYGEFSLKPPLGDVPIYKNGEPVLTDLAIAANEEAVLSPFKFRSKLVRSQFFWGYIEYIDIFKHKRRSRFCAYLDIDPAKAGRQKYQLAGSEPWRECD